MEESFNQLLKEAKETSIKIGDTFTLGGDLGEFKKGEEVEVSNKERSGEDVILTLSNSEGKSDTFYLDKSDDFEELI